MSIIKCVSKPANLLKITLSQNKSESTIDDDRNDKLQMKKVGAYSLLKENKIYALSNFSCGFVTLIDSNNDNYWYLGFKRLKSYMNRYFMERYLRRDPIMYRMSYKAKCLGCSKCLNKLELQNDLNNLVKNGLNSDNDRSQTNETSTSFLKMFYKKFFQLKPILSKEALEQKKAIAQLKKAKFSDLIEKSKETNEMCGKTFSNDLKQVQIISNINEPYYDSKDDINTCSIGTVIVKDPLHNSKDMFLAKKKHLTQFEIKKMTNLSSRDKDYSTEDYFALEIDGEIYKLNNKPGNDLKVNVELIENCINILQFDEDLSNSIKANAIPKIFLLSSRTLNEYFFQNSKSVLKMPPILPFEHFYLNYWKPDR
jgi:hypothetical protein